MPKTVTQRLNALEQKLFSDMEKEVLRYKHLAALENRVEAGLRRGRIVRERLREVERSIDRHQARVVSLKDAVGYNRDRFNDRVLDVVRRDWVRSRDARVTCFGRFLYGALLLVLAGFSVYGIGHALGWVS